MSGEPRLIRSFDSVDSTNERALALAAAGAPGGTVVVAGEQTAGRGRRGRTWHSPEGGLYLSYVVRDLDTLPRPGMLTLAAGVAAAGAIHAVTGFDVRLKWPNDVLTPGAPLKLAGILAEGSSVGSRLEVVIIGVGINVSLASVPPELRAIAASLEGELGRPVDRAALQQALIARLDAEVARLRAGGHDGMLREWSALSPGARDHEVSWRDDGGVRRGITAGIDDEGALLVRVRLGREGTEQGEGAPRVTEPGGVQGPPPERIERLIAGEVVWA